MGNKSGGIPFFLLTSAAEACFVHMNKHHTSCLAPPYPVGESTFQNASNEAQHYSCLCTQIFHPRCFFGLDSPSEPFRFFVLPPLLDLTLLDDDEVEPAPAPDAGILDRLTSLIVSLTSRSTTRNVIGSIMSTFKSTCPYPNKTRQTMSSSGPKRWAERRREKSLEVFPCDRSKSCNTVY